MADRDRVGSGIDCSHITTLTAASDAQSAALADGVVLDAAMLADYRALAVKREAGTVCNARADKGAVVACGDEANVGALALLGDCELVSGGDRTHLSFAQTAHRKQGHRQRLWAERVEEVGLVLLRVNATQELCSVLAAYDSRVMSGCDPVGLQRASLVEEAVELDVGVAVEAGVWRATLGVLGDELVDHELPERPLEVEGVVGNP